MGRGRGPGPEWYHCLRHEAKENTEKRGVGGGRGGLDELDHLIDVGQRDGLPFEHMGAITGFAQVKNGAPCHHLATV